LNIGELNPQNTQGDRMAINTRLNCSCLQDTSLLGTHTD
jgi:hypothetical protein